MSFCIKLANRCKPKYLGILLPWQAHTLRLDTVYTTYSSNFLKAYEPLNDPLLTLIMTLIKPRSASKPLTCVAVCLCVFTYSWSQSACVSACNSMHMGVRPTHPLFLDTDHLINIQRAGGRGTAVCTDTWKHISCLPTYRWVEWDEESTAGGASVCVQQERPSFCACVGSSVWNWVPVSLPPTLSLSLPLSLTLSIFVSSSLAHCISIPLCGCHHNACGHTSLSRLFIMGDHQVPQTLGNRVGHQPTVAYANTHAEYTENIHTCMSTRIKIIIW